MDRKPSLTNDFWLLEQFGILTLPDGEHRRTIRTETENGDAGSDTITFLSSQSGRYDPPMRQAGEEANAIGAYLEKGISGPRRGPNKSACQW